MLILMSEGGHHEDIVFVAKVDFKTKNNNYLFKFHINTFVLRLISNFCLKDVQDARI